MSSGSSSATRASRCGLKIDRLPPGGGQGHDAGATDLAAGAGGGGNGHDGRNVGADEAVAAGRVVVVDERTRVGDLERDELPGVERRASADGDDGLGAVGQEGHHAVGHVLLHGVGIDVGEDCRGDAAFLEQRAHPLGDAHPGHPGVAHHQRASGADALHVLGHAAHRAGPEDDGRGKSPGDDGAAHGRKA